MVKNSGVSRTGRILENLHSHSYLSYQKGEPVRIRAIYGEKKEENQNLGRDREM